MSLVDPNQLNDCVNEAKCHNYEIVYKTHFKLFFCFLRCLKMSKGSLNICFLVCKYRFGTMWMELYTAFCPCQRYERKQNRWYVFNQCSTFI